MDSPRAKLTQRLETAIKAAFDLEGVDPLVRVAQNRQFGDYQANVAMSLAKRLGRKPVEIAQEILEKLDVDGLSETTSIAGPGFINFALERNYLDTVAKELALDPRLGVALVEPALEVVIDYSGPNVAKEMHVGHLRPTVIGDSLARVLAFAGHRVTRRNHLGDWGTQFGMLIEYMTDSGTSVVRGGSISDLNAFYRAAKERFDEDADFAQRARARVVALQAGDRETLTLWQQLIDESKIHFNAVYEKLDVLLTDDDVCGESFYNPFLDDLIRELEQKEISRISDGAVCVFVPGFENKEGKPVPMIVQKSDGGFGYDATDLAALRFRVRELGSERSVYVVDARQSGHFEQVFWTSKRAGWLDEHHVAEHVPFGMVLGDDGRPFKTRSGETVLLSKLLDEAIERATRLIEEKNPDIVGEERSAVAHMVGIGAIKYADLSGDRIKNYKFSWEKMLATDGNTAVYLQYAHARIQSILRKAEIDPSKASALPIAIAQDPERDLVLVLSQLGDVLDAASRKLEPHHLCTWLFELATTYTRFWDNCPVLKAESDEVRNSRLALCALTAKGLQLGMGLLGITAPARM